MSDPEAAKAMAIAQQEMEYRVELFNRMVSTCFDKCIEKKHKDGDMNVGENSCTDRCTAKYWQVTGMVGQMLGGQGVLQQ